MMKKILGTGIACLAAMTAFTSAINFSFSSFAPQDPIGEKFADAHFFTPGNDYAGLFFWLPTEQVLPAEAVTLGGDTRYCTKRVRGLYFSNAWGARLWPIDRQTLTGLVSIDQSYTGITMTGGFYTSCSNATNTGSLELYSVYGQMNYAWKGKVFSISMGRKYNINTNSAIPGGPLVSNTQYFNNQTPLGYFYDNIAGIGFIGGVLPLAAHSGIVAHLNTGGYLNSTFSFDTGSTSVIVARVNGTSYTLSGAVSAGLNTLWRIAVLGNVLLSRGGLGLDDRRSILGNPSSSAIVVSDKMNISNSINQLKRTASELCRGKKVYDNGNWRNATESVVCIGAASNEFSELDPIDFDPSVTASYKGKTIVVYNRNVIIQGNMPKDSAINMFVDRGNVLLRAPSAIDTNFDKDGNVNGSITGMYLRGNIFINGLLMGYAGAKVPNKLYIHGKFASLNTGLEPTTARKNQIESLFTNATTTYGTNLVTNFCGGTNCVNFNNTFTWECQLNGQGTDGNVCNLTGDRFKYNPLVIIDTNIPSMLLQ